MKKILALCMTMLMALAVLTGCMAADPNNPYGQEPAPMNGSTSAVLENTERA